MHARTVSVMGRPPRPQFPGATYHVTARGAVGRAIFGCRADRQRFVELLSETVRRHEWLCGAYCVMSTHYHLLVTTPHGDLGAGMRRLNRAYARTFNLRTGGSGAVFEARYHAVLIDNDTHLLETIRYIALNPVRAGLVARPEDWSWGSYGALAGKSNGECFQSTAHLLDLFGKRPDVAREQCVQFVEDGIPLAVSDTAVSDTGRT